MSDFSIRDTAAATIVRAEERFHSNFGWLDSRHSFKFGRHYHPAHGGHGLLIVSNDNKVAPGGGFGTHGHRDMEIVTWVLSGELEHRDSEGNYGVLHPGLAQRMSAGTGIEHSEMNASAVEPVHLVQMWVPPDRAGYAPSYAQRDVKDDLAAGGLVPVVSGRGHGGAVSINQPGAALWVGRLRSGEHVALPHARFVHVFVARGSASLGGDLKGQVLSEGGACRLTEAGPLSLQANEVTEILVWESDAAAS